MTVVTPKFGMGASVLRRADAAFILGHDVKHIDMPATPARIWAAIREAEAT